MKISNPKMVAAILALAVASSTAVVPRKSHAGLGIIVTIAPTLVVSPIFIPLYYMLAVAGGASALDKLAEARASGNTWKYLQAGFMAAFGVLMLESNASGSMDFASISDAAADKAGLTAAERAAYAAELPMLNAIREESFARMESKLAKSHPSFSEVAEELRLQWLELSRQGLSPEATSAMEKLAASARNSI